MKKLFKILLSTVGASLSVYFNVMLIPVTVLFLAMLADYVSGVVAAWFLGELNSSTGKKGALKKVCYMFLVVAAGIVDWVIHCGLGWAGVEYSQSLYFGLIVTVWLILNELLSILENCTRIGLPVPAFLKPVANRLKIMVESKKEDENGV